MPPSRELVPSSPQEPGTPIARMRSVSRTAEAFTDVFAEVPIGASPVIGVATAHDQRGMATRLHASIRAAHDGGRRFEPQDLPEAGPRRAPKGFAQ